MNDTSKKTHKELMEMAAEMFDNNDAIVVITMNAEDDENVSTNVMLHEAIGLSDDSNALRAMYFTALGAMLGGVLDRYPVEQVFGYIKHFLEVEVEGKGKQRH
jgi:hypothetical protein